MADMLRNFGGGGDASGAGGMADMMNNPMMAEMAQQMLANGGMARLMQNPAIANMVCFLQ
jgi:small glutamine-rich tetratricopeptide repeat-containing protein alpha